MMIKLKQGTSSEPMVFNPTNISDPITAPSKSSSAPSASGSVPSAPAPPTTAAATTAAAITPLSRDTPPAKSPEAANVFAATLTEWVKPPRDNYLTCGKEITTPIPPGIQHSNQYLVDILKNHYMIL